MFRLCRGRLPPSGPLFFHFVQFWGNYCPKIRLVPLYISPVVDPELRCAGIEQKTEIFFSKIVPTSTWTIMTSFSSTGSATNLLPNYQIEICHSSNLRTILMSYNKKRISTMFKIVRNTSYASGITVFLDLL